MPMATPCDHRARLRSAVPQGLAILLAAFWSWPAPNHPDGCNRRLLVLGQFAERFQLSPAHQIAAAHRQTPPGRSPRGYDLRLAAIQERGVSGIPPPSALERRYSRPADRRAIVAACGSRVRTLPAVRWSGNSWTGRRCPPSPNRALTSNSTKASGFEPRAIRMDWALTNQWRNRRVRAPRQL